MTALVCGSLAFDNVMTFQDRFRDHILPDQLHILNVSFLVPGMKRDYEGALLSGEIQSHPFVQPTPEEENPCQLKKSTW